jgi:hydrogenase nickel incorporation protein HypA/HybF
VHEFSLAEQVLAIVLAAAREHLLTRVAVVHMEIGQISGVSLEALSFAWEFVRSSDPLTAGAVLDIKQPTGHGKCAACGYDGPVTEPLRICPHCGMTQLEITRGLEFNVLSISGE